MLAVVDFVGGAVGSEVVAHDEPCGLKLREHAVDRRKPDLDVLGHELLINVFGAEVALLLVFLCLLEDLQNAHARHRRLQTSVLEFLYGHIPGGIELVHQNLLMSPP